MQSACQSKHAPKREEAVREDLPLSLQKMHKGVGRLETPRTVPNRPAFLQIRTFQESW